MLLLQLNMTIEAQVTSVAADRGLNTPQGIISLSKGNLPKYTEY